MSSLDKLAIRGIRSFDDKDLSVIQFYSPLTVIVGHNGSGKTTIIESLKYACTGDLPPNTKGGAFVHDPNIAGVSEVKAQVKLRFFNVKKNKMIVERRLEVKKKKNVSGLSMKTLEATISLDNQSGEGDRKKRRTLSTKCASLDEEVAYQLGVSKAILENVIFCHQEESNWPLSDSSALKKKFDDIFESTKYTKALDQLKTLRKEYSNELKVDQEKVKALRTDRERASKLRKAIDELSNLIEIKTSEHDRLDQEIVTLSRSNAKFFDQAAGYKNTLSKVETLTQRRQLLETNLDQIRSTLDLLQDSDVELEKKINNHNDEMQQIKQQRQLDKQKLDDEQDVLASNEKKRSRTLTKHGQLTAEKERHLTNLENLQNLVKELSLKHGILGFDHDLNQEEIQDFEDKLENAILVQSTKIEKIKNEAKVVEGQKQQKIQELKSEKAADERAKQTLQTQKTNISSRINQLTRQIESIQTNESDVNWKKQSLIQDKQRFEKLSNELKQSNHLQQLRNVSKELKEFEDERESLHVELNELNNQSNVRVQLNLKQIEVKKRQESIQSLLDKNAISCRKFTRAEPSRESIETNVNAAINELERDIKVAERTQRDATKELQSIETGVSIAKRKLQTLKDQSSGLQSEINASLRDRDTESTTIEDAIAEAEATLVAERESLQERESMGEFFQQILNKGQQQRHCIGCDRDIQENEFEKFQIYCERKIKKNPKKIEEAKQSVDYWTNELNELRKVLPNALTLKKMNTQDIPSSQIEVEEVNSKLIPLSNQVETATNELNNLREKMTELESLKRVANEVSRLSRECDDIARDVTQLESELQATGSTATGEEIQIRLTDIANKIRNNKTLSEKIRSEQQSQQAMIATLSNSIHTNELELTKVEQELKDREVLEQRKQQEQQQLNETNDNLHQLNLKLIQSNEPIQEIENELKQIQKEFTQKESLSSIEFQNLNKSFESIQTIKREIQSYESKGTSNELVKCSKELQEQETILNQSKQKINQLLNEISKKDQNLSDSNSSLRNLHDNLRFRNEEIQLNEIVQELNSLDEEGARRAFRDFETKYHQLRQKQTNEQARQAKIGGEIEMMKKEMNDKTKELDEEYKNVDQQFFHELIKTKVTQAASDDLLKYSKALDAAIMRFHGLKMAEINDTIADLWTKTYQGTDIDKIMIKSDAEGKLTGTRASYNYRVVMFKDTTEMDMRGRCSAGQKVLASIIIRLALAESFGVNCGVMALDEPTTNLDQDNIEALGRSLSDIIKERKAQSNFQLIVITHDENLLTQLSTTGALDKYWRVSRGDGGQVSKVERQRLV
ncbi:DNA repair protein rad50 [Microbotryomycetes sp. JL221]|nr:DNA repair protein rad50 [Microbotryomycetes sp. JL221]